MNLDPILGVGRDARYLSPVLKTELTYTGNVPFPQQTLTGAITHNYEMVLYAIVSVSVNNATAFGGEVDVFLSIDNEQIAKYVVPTGQAGQAVYEIVNIGRLFQNYKNFQVVHGGATNGGGAANYTVSVTYFSKEI